MEEKGKKAADFLVLPRPAESFENVTGFSGKARTHWGCQIEKGWPRRHKASSGKDALASFAKQEIVR